MCDVVLSHDSFAIAFVLYYKNYIVKFCVSRNERIQLNGVYRTVCMHERERAHACRWLSLFDLNLWDSVKQIERQRERARACARMRVHIYSSLSCREYDGMSQMEMGLFGRVDLTDLYTIKRTVLRAYSRTLCNIHFCVVLITVQFEQRENKKEKKLYTYAMHYTLLSALTESNFSFRSPSGMLPMNERDENWNRQFSEAH